MGRLLYHANTSLDGYVNDEQGGLEWSAPSSEVLGAINDQERTVGTYLYGRRLYETMRVWQEIPDDETQTPEMRDYGRMWRAAEKIVFSSTLEAVSTPRTRLERSLNSERLRSLKDAGDGEMDIGGATLAGAALRWGLVDEVRLHVVPVAIGGGTRALPERLQARFELLDERRYANGTVYLRYQVRPAAENARGPA
ncbi:MAG: dihydrofolate reductase family protein [Candidatus Dormibacteraeota bacterium]|nr:dihydrofolate reductase family protein [Candidatus Dormibacteraeota bacterium]